MGYGKDFESAARRHLRAACELYVITSPSAQPGCHAVAGYLFGISGELAVKQIMRRSGMTPLEPSERRNDPFYAHFEELKTSLKDHIQGRRAGELRKISEDASLFQFWNTDMRYAPTSDICPKYVRKWHDDAVKLIQTMDYDR